MNKDKKALFNSFKLKIAIMVMFTIIASSAATFGFFYANKSQSGTTSMTTTCFDVSFTEGTSFINLTNAVSQTDNSGQKTNPYTFTIKNTCDEEARYHVIMNIKTNSIDSNYIRYSLNTETASTLSDRPINNVFEIDEAYDKSYVLKVGTLAKDETVTYDVRAWISASATYEDVQGESWEAEIKIVSTVEELESNKDTIVEKIIASANTGTPDFNQIATTDEGVYAMEDNYGMSYYFRGAVEDNYVKFAGFYWRIVRINGDGSVRIIYDGTEPHSNGEASEDRVALTGIAWNTTNYNDAKYVGYMYGGANGEASTSKEQAQINETSSNVKTHLEVWYKNNIEDRGYSKYLADVIFCNDRSTAETAGEWRANDTALGYGTNITAYGVYERFYDVANNSWDRGDSTPTFVCPTNNTVSSNNDWFTAEATIENKGNGALDYPVGLITLDESAAAGGKVYLLDDSARNLSYYLYKGHWYWSLSPKDLYTNSHAMMFLVGGHGDFTYSSVFNNAGSIAPVINLTPEYAATMRGTGTMDDPYQSWED